jgi:hypothetical protein
MGHNMQHRNTSCTNCTNGTHVPVARDSKIVCCAWRSNAISTRQRTRHFTCCYSNHCKQLERVGVSSVGLTTTLYFHTNVGFERCNSVLAPHTFGLNINVQVVGVCWPSLFICLAQCHFLRRSDIHRSKVGGEGDEIF